MVAFLFKWLIAFSLVNFQTSINSPFKGAGGNHPIYVSVTEIEHNAKDKTLEISCKIFTDDFEKTLRQAYKTHVDLLAPKDKTAMNKLVSGYIQKHLLIKADGKPVVLEFMGFEQEEEGIISFFQVSNIAYIKKINITNNILYEYKKEQISLIHLLVNDKRQSTKLINPEEKASFEF